MNFISLSPQKLRICPFFKPCFLFILGGHGAPHQQVGPPPPVGPPGQQVGPPPVPPVGPFNPDPMPPQMGGIPNHIGGGWGGAGPIGPIGKKLGFGQQMGGNQGVPMRNNKVRKYRRAVSPVGQNFSPVRIHVS